MDQLNEVSWIRLMSLTGTATTNGDLRWLGPDVHNNFRTPNHGRSDFLQIGKKIVAVCREMGMGDVKILSAIEDKGLTTPPWTAEAIHDLYQIVRQSVEHPVEHVVNSMCSALDGDKPW